MRFFNTTGPCDPEMHYMLPPEERLSGAQLHRYVKDHLYWVLHAPRQTGKTTFLKSWMRELNKTDDYVACYVSVEITQRVQDVDEAMSLINREIRVAAEDTGYRLPIFEGGQISPPFSDTLRNFAEIVAPKKLIILFDEVDVLEGDPLIRFLRALRSGFANRGTGTFPVSIALVGMRDLKDYITAAKEGVAPNPGSPFNIKEDSSTLTNFNKESIVALFAQRTAETGQQITQEALDYVWEQSYGQPWIVNNLFKRATLRILDAESTEPVTLEIVRQARLQMIEARETHLDALVYRLQDARVRRVVQAILTGEANPPLSRFDDDVALTMDLGLIRYDTQKGFVISNPIYTEMIIRVLNTRYQDATAPPSEWNWQNPDGSLNMNSLLKEFQRFWRRNGDIWEEKADYTEAFPHLLLMAFLQRILNGGGTIDREVASGRGRMDLFVQYFGYKCVIEIKIRHDYDSYDFVLDEGLRQINRYRSKIDSSIPAYLVIFDRRSEGKRASWDERLTWKDNVEDGITVVGG